MEKVLEIDWQTYTLYLERMARDLELLWNDAKLFHRTLPSDSVIAKLEGSMLLDPSRKRSLFGLHCTAVYGEPRGGLIPAVALAHRLGIELSLSHLGRPLFVDDIFDTGVTVQKLWDAGMAPQSFHAFLFYRDNAPPVPGPVYYVKRVTPEDGKVIFPYEVRR